MRQRQVILLWFVATFVMVFVAVAADPDAASLANAILDDSKPQGDREAIIKDNPRLSAELIAAMTRDLTPSTKEEYRRIPWVWRDAIAAGKRNEIEEMKRILLISLPQPGQPLDDWRAVVIGGGIINGITQAGAWPDERIAKMFETFPPVEALRWQHTLELAAKMANDPKIATGTRYDALRILGAGPWDRWGAILVRYQIKGTEAELQMGAVSALGDVREPGAAVAQVLISGLPHYDKANKALALDALIRDEPRALVLLDALANGRIKADELGPKRVELLKTHASELVRRRAGELLGN